MTPAQLVSREFFDVMGVRPVIGRGFNDDELRVGGPRSGRRQRPVLADSASAARRSAISRCGSNDAIHQVVGVMPRGLRLSGRRASSGRRVS